MRRRHIGAAVLALLMAVAAFLVVWPEAVFKVDAKAVGSSVDDELGSNHTIYECVARSGPRYECAYGSPGSGACCFIKVKLEADRCWQALPDRKGRDQDLSGCLGLTDYLFDGTDGFGE